MTSAGSGTAFDPSVKTGSASLEETCPRFLRFLLFLLMLTKLGAVSMEVEVEVEDRKIFLTSPGNSTGI